ncbi:MAG TPA: ABC transporter permease [Acidimicrobiales bacterium]|jgi:ABC-2 type transport system permease protein|nr:ABC transporter permease [Acidimicrobiales bacterium]
MTISVDQAPPHAIAVPAHPDPVGTSLARRRLAMVAHQVRYDTLALVRNPTAQGFAFGMPIAFLVLFVAIFGNGTMHVDGHAVKGSTYYVAALTVFAIVDVAFMAMVIAMVERREHGVLRRRRATPQPAWTVIAGTAITSIMSGAVSAALLLAVGRLAYGATVAPAAVPALLVAVAVGVVVFCALGFAVAGLIKSFDSAQPVVTALALPLMFISGVFIPWGIIPHWLQQVSGVFPVRPLAVAILDPYLAHHGAGGWSASSYAVLAAWGLAGVVVAVRRFGWAPRDV